MSATVTSLWRHPIKSHGREALQAVDLTAGACLPWDRAWAVAHETSRATGEAWATSHNFCLVSKNPALAAIEAELDEARGTVTLRHPDRPSLTFDPDHEAAAFLDWVAPLMVPERASPARIVRVPGRGMTDSDFPSVTLCNRASHRAVEQRLGHPLSEQRWRGNVWIDGPAPWQEFEWMGRRVQIGEAVLEVRERTDRCLATAANPETGRRDADTLGALDSWGHRDFSVRAEVMQGGRVAVGDPVVEL